MTGDVHQYDPYYESDTNSTRQRQRRLKVLFLFDKRFRIGLVAVVALSLAACAHWWWWGTDNLLPRVIHVETRADLLSGGGCRPYGCPVYPPELDDEVGKEIATVKERKLRKSQNLEDYMPVIRYGSLQMAALSQMGKDHIENQDRGVIVSPFHANGGSSDFLVGLFDGHGDEGHYVSTYLSRDVPELLREKLTDLSNDETEETIKRILVETFIEADQGAPPNAMNGGSTASVILRRKSKLFVANAGDSLSFIATYSKSTGKVDIVYRNRFDKPHLSEEHARIEGMGGKVHIPDPPARPAMARVIAYSSVKREMVGLAMSRSIGDWEHGAIGVTAEPIVDAVSINDIIDGLAAQEKDTEVFVISGSDGLFDARRPEFVAKRMASSFYQVDGDHPVVESENVIRMATPHDPKRYRDDITILALKVDL